MKTTPSVATATGTMVAMVRRGRGGTAIGVVVSAVVVVAGGALTWWMLPQVKVSEADSAGVLSFGVGVIGTVAGVWGLNVALRTGREQRTPDMIAEVLTRSVLRLEGAEYRQLLGGGRSALNGRIDLPFRVVAAPGVEGVDPGGTLEGVGDFFLRLRPGRLVITGTAAPAAGHQEDAGTGKTVLALALALQLAERWEPGARVPVRLTAATWPGGRLSRWLEEHLVDVYRLPRRDAHALVESNRLLPVIDGLDELDPALPSPGDSRAAELMREVERYELGGGRAPVVMTCRGWAYAALADAEAQPQITAHVALDRVDGARARRYLEARVGYSARNRARWQPVLDALDPPPGSPPGTADPEVRRALSTPWRLTLAAVVYEERATGAGAGAFRRRPQDLLALAGTGALYTYLLDHYVTAAVHSGRADENESEAEREARTREYGTERLPRLDPRSTWRYLAVLAGYLHANTAGSRHRAGRSLSGVDLVLHELWPLAPRSRVVGGALTAALVIGQLAAVLAVMGRVYGEPDPGRPVVVTGFVVLAGLGALGRGWPVPLQLELRSLRTWAERFRALAKVVVATATGAGLGGLGGVVAFLLIGAWMGFLLAVAALLDVLTGGDGGSGARMFGQLFSSILVTGAVLGLLVGLVAGVANVLLRPRSEPTGDPRTIVRTDALSALGVALATVTAAVLILGLTAHMAVDLGNIPGRGPARPMVLGGVLGLASVALALALGRSGAVTVRYLAFLLCTRGLLPWRLSRFLYVCYRLGLLRVAGIGYQFRHRELQQHLAARPQAPPGP
ncbi:NACHT domain-containing protein [Streptomyces sp. NPDC051018]|uniref:NACHT domain-containing protein n=1 Tax=Streptomyces sp. NPDC051018 TaxID=3365639 RepID=UPI0037AB383E